MVGVEAQSGDPLRVTASGPGLERTGVIVNHKTYFDVHTRSTSVFCARSDVLVYIGVCVCSYIVPINLTLFDRGIRYGDSVDNTGEL